MRDGFLSDAACFEYVARHRGNKLKMAKKTEDICLSLSDSDGEDREALLYQGQGLSTARDYQDKKWSSKRTLVVVHSLLGLLWITLFSALMIFYNTNIRNASPYRTSTFTHRRLSGCTANSNRSIATRHIIFRASIHFWLRARSFRIPRETE